MNILLSFAQFEREMISERTRDKMSAARKNMELAAILRLGRIGFDHVKGYLEGGMAALAGRPDLVWPTERVGVPTLAEELAAGDPPLVLDVRSPGEWAARHIEGSVNVPLNHLQERVDEIRRHRRIAVHCAGGYRSSLAASILQQYGITNVIEMAADWRLGKQLTCRWWRKRSHSPVRLLSRQFLKTFLRGLRSRIMLRSSLPVHTNGTAWVGGGD